MRRRTLLTTGAAALAAPAIRAQAAWPHGRPIRVIVPFPPGAVNDLLGRMLAQRLQDKLGATAVVENRVGGNGVVGTGHVVQSAPDGYTLLASAFNTVVLHLVTPNLPFDPMADLDVVARTGVAPLVMVMTPDRPQTTIAEVVAAAKADPRNWTFAITSVGSAGHLATIEFNRRSGANVEMAPYRGTQPALTDVIAGNVQLLIDPAFALLPAARGGRVKALGIASAQRSELAPDLPTMREAGLGDFVFNSWYGIWAPRGTPAEIKGRVNALMAEAMREPETRSWLTQRLVEPVAETAEEARAFMVSEEKRARELLASVNFKPA
ncbi:tripartite tricarboxylate transporter substrate binding protein [Elioraea sp.]|uniref:Bug family tripartite tricarboxylate transporter substrate binding protein n=1 Tax=Elioraea sp. TaxID=2185103 RepID=UPI00307D4C2B